MYTRYVGYPVALLILICLLGLAACNKDKAEPIPVATVTSLSPTAGPGGSTVTIMGTNFSAEAAKNAVQFNGKATPVVAASSTRLTVTVPAGAGTGKVTVQVNNQAAVEGPVFTYVYTASVSTIAGSGSSGFANGPAISAQFKDLNGVAADKAGNVYVADYADHRIRKISPTGVVSTFAGTGEAGHADGAAGTAKFNNPMGLAVDKDGNLIVADHSNKRIRKITPAGVVSTLAGSGNQGYADGDAATALFNFPTGVAVDGAGNVYVADFFNHRIRKITPAGQVSTLAGNGTEGNANGTGEAARFAYPAGITADANGNLYVADRDNSSIRKITPTGQVTTLAGGQGGFADGVGAAAKFDQPFSVTVDAQGTVYAADRGNSRIRKVTPSGEVTTLAGSTAGYRDGTAEASQFSGPVGVTMDAAGDLYVAESQNYRVRKISFK